MQEAPSTLTTTQHRRITEAATGAISRRTLTRTVTRRAATAACLWGTARRPPSTETVPRQLPGSTGVRSLLPTRPPRSSPLPRSTSMQTPMGSELSLQESSSQRKHLNPTQVSFESITSIARRKLKGANWFRLLTTGVMNNLFSVLDDRGLIFRNIQTTWKGKYRNTNNTK